MTLDKNSLVRAFCGCSKISSGVPCLGDLSAVHEEHARADLSGKAHLVRDDDHRRAELVDALEQAHDLQRARGVQVARRLVGDDGAGVVG